MYRDVFVEKVTYYATFYQFVWYYAGNDASCFLGCTGYAFHQSEAGTTIDEPPSLLTNPTPQQFRLFVMA